MRKERVAAFTDAVLAIIMTILVLELKKPSILTMDELWELRDSFFSYILSFFWLGSMWINIHNEWEKVEKISSKTIWINLILLFFCSMIPYATDLVSRDFNNKIAQGFYGIFAILVTVSNIWLSREIKKTTDRSKIVDYIINKRLILLSIDIIIKIIGFIIAMSLYPPAMMYSVIIAAMFLMTSIFIMKLDWSDIQ